MSKTEAFMKARQLFIEQGVTGRDAAKAVGVTDTHLYRWINKYGWRDLRERYKVENAKEIKKTANEILRFLIEAMPAHEAQINEVITEYLRSKIISNG